MSITGSDIAEDVHETLTSGSDFLRAHHLELPRERVLPAIVITPAGGFDEMHLRGESGLSSALIQLGAWATTRKGAADYMKAARLKMLSGSTFQVAKIDFSGATGKDEETGLFCCARDMTIWFNP